MNIHKIIKEYNKLKCPKGLFDPSTLPFWNDKYFVICSERSSGKTTNVILMGMIAHKLEGIQIQYIRSRSEMIERRNIRQLFDVIKQYDYIQKITDGKYSSVVYKSFGWYYCNYDADGKPTDVPEDPFMMCLALDDSDRLKSTYNAPKGDWIIFDEFVSIRYNPQDEFLFFMDVLKTITRNRETPFIFMLANTIDRYNNYFYELELADIIASMPIGEHAETITSGGVPIYVELYSPTKTPDRVRVNHLYFGFKNKKLGSINGQGWAITPVPHITHDDTRQIICDSLYILYEDHIVRLKICTSDNDGLHVTAHFAKPKKFHKDTIIYTLGLSIDWRYRYRFGHSKRDKMVWTLYERKKFFFQNNSVGAIVNKYYEEATKKRRIF